MSTVRLMWRSPWLAATALYVGLTLAYAWPLLPVIGSALPNDTGDPGLNAWILWWNAHAVPLTARWWDAPIFYPAHGALALSETFLNLAPLSSPLQWAGLSAVLTYNLMYLLAFPAAALAAHALAHRLTGRHDAAIIAGLAFGFAPYRAAQMPHLQTLWSCWMPLGLFALHRYIGQRRQRDLWLFGVCWLMNGLATGYYLFFFSSLVGLWILWFARSWRAWVAIGATIVIASLPLVPLLLGYQRVQAAFGLSRSMQEIEFFSADLSAIWATTPYVWPHLWTIDPRPEGELYPGVVIMLLALSGAVVAWRHLRPARRYRAQPFLFAAGGALALLTYLSWRAGGWAFKLVGLTVSLTRPAKAVFLTLCLMTAALFWNPRIVQAWRRSSALLFYSVAAVIMLLLALGPVGHVFGARFMPTAPYYWLMQLPGGHAFRVPARFAMLVVLCLAEAAAVAFTRLTPRGARTSVTAAVALAVALEGFVPNMGVAIVPPPLDFAGLDRGAVVLELPLNDEYSDTAAMLRATRTGHGLVNGFSGYVPPHYPLLQEGLRNLDGSILAALQQSGPLLVFVRQDADADHRTRDFMEEVPDAHRVLTAASGSLYQLPARVIPSLGPARPLPASSIRVSTGEMHLAEMTDGDLTTRWLTPFSQAVNDRVTATFDQPMTFTRVELDLGAFKDDYPRKLRVSVSDDGETFKPVWEGSTAGLAMLATLNDRLVMPIAIDLPSLPRGRQLQLSIVTGHPTFSWSIAELKVFGR